MFPSCEWDQLASWFHNQQEVPRDNISQRFPPQQKIKVRLQTRSRVNPDCCVFFLRGVNANSSCPLIFYDRLNLSSRSLGGIWTTDVIKIPDSSSHGGASTTHQHQMTDSHRNQKVAVNTRHTNSWQLCRFQERLSKSVASTARTRVTATYEKTKENKSKKSRPQSQLQSSSECHIEQLLLVRGHPSASRHNFNPNGEESAQRRLASREE